MNFTYTVSEPTDKSWGALLPDGSWTGIVRMLQDGKVDLGEKLSLEALPLEHLCEYIL